jgi:hypothetical protein
MEDRKNIDSDGDKSKEKKEVDHQNKGHDKVDTVTKV